MTTHIPSPSSSTPDEPRRLLTAARPASRFLSKEECAALAQRIARFAVGGGRTRLSVASSWTGNIAWARNQITTSGDVRNNNIEISRIIRGASADIDSNQIDDAELEASVRRAERILIERNEDLDAGRKKPTQEPFETPVLWFDRTYQLDAAARATTMRDLVKPAEQAGMLAAGYIEVSANGIASISGVDPSAMDLSVYCPVTYAQYSVTVRDPQGTGSGWAGVDGNDWGKIDAAKLSAIALEKCLTSRNPVAVEPGRYLTILEPQAVADFLTPLMTSKAMDRYAAEERRPTPGPFSGDREHESRIGELVMDERITITADPMDPEMPFLPFEPFFSSQDINMPVYHPVTWFEHGVLKQLAYTRDYAVEQLGLGTGLPNKGAFHMSGGPTSVAEMIASTKRGILVTRFDDVQLQNLRATMVTGYTRDGIWLIENGKISKPVKNFRFTEGILIALNNLVNIGPAQRVFSPDAPIVVPPLQIRDFSFTSLADAI